MKISPGKASLEQQFEAFSNKKRIALLQKNPNLNQTEISKIIKQQWSKSNKKVNKNTGVKPSTSNLSSEARKMKQQDMEDIVPIKLNMSGIKKTKKIAKPSQQRNFSKFYFHPRWTKTQIKCIIRLLWRKKQTTGMMLMREKQIPERKRIYKPVSGRTHFGNIKRKAQMNAKEIETIWRTLPRQSKKFWKLKGNNTDGFKTSMRMRIGRINNCKSSAMISQFQTPFCFMNKAI